jgi:hypothetical protein
VKFSAKFSAKGGYFLTVFLHLFPTFSARGAKLMQKIKVAPFKRSKYIAFMDFTFYEVAASFASRSEV